MFNPQKFQTIVPYFDLEMGGLKRIYDNPNIPIEFEMTLSKNNYPTVMFSLFDEAGWEVEPFIKDSRNPETGLPGGSFQFGYKGDANIDSPKYGFNIQNVKPGYRNNAFYVNIYGFLATASPLISSNQFSGTLEEVIYDWAELHKFDDVIIEPKFGKSKMTERGFSDSDSTVKSEKRHSKLMHESDWRFLQRILYYAVDEQGRPGYYPVITSENGESILRIVRSQDATADYAYKVQDKDSVVRSWDYDITYIPILDSSDTHFNAHHKINGYTVKSSLNQKVTEKYQELLGYSAYEMAYSLPPKEPPSQIRHMCAEQMEEEVTKGAIRARSRSANVGGASVLPELYSHIKRWAGLNTATLEVCGDPRIQVVNPNNGISLVDVDFRTPQNWFNTSVSEKHYSAGTWMLSEVRHSLGLSGFTSTLSLERASNIFEAKKEGQE